ncbi:MAG: hypothetical protein OEV37_00850 [Candidatus Berkelbacteria bacterium]|nr:hypothetical protein [Candidatus Berkelbacteria bacterium]
MRRETVIFGISATSSNPIVPSYISKSPILKEKIEYIVLGGNINDFTLRVYRQSSSTIGKLSCDNYRIKNFQAIGRVKKDKDIKYPQKPIPQGAILYSILGHKVFSMKQLNKKELGLIKRIMLKRRII